MVRSARSPLRLSLAYQDGDDYPATDTSHFARVEAQRKQEGEVRSGILRKPA